METIEDIIAQMQQAGKLLGGETGGIIRMYADRIDKAYEHQCAPTSKESLQVGNTAKMREALKEIQAIITVYNKGFIATQRTVDTIEEIITQVLSAPARNCDLYTSGDIAWNAFRRINPPIDMPPLLESLMFREWLFEEARISNE